MVRQIELIYDDDSEEVVLVVDGTPIEQCKQYETDVWVAAAVEALGGEYSQREDGEAVWSFIEAAREAK
jgi:hypothetical protein